MYEKEVEEYIKKQIKVGGATLQDAAGYIGLRSRQALQDKLAKGNLKATEERGLAEAYGCHVTWQREDCRDLSEADFEADREKMLAELLAVMKQRENLFEEVMVIFEANQALKRRFKKEDIDKIEQLNEFNQRTMLLWGKFVGTCQARYEPHYAMTLILEAEADINNETRFGIHYGSTFTLY